MLYCLSMINSRSMHTLTDDINSMSKFKKSASKILGETNKTFLFPLRFQTFEVF